MNRNNVADYINEIFHKFCHNKKNCIELQQVGLLPNITTNIF